MSSIGPQIPPHLLAQFQRTDSGSGDDDSDSGPQLNTVSIGPEIPSRVQAEVSDASGPRSAIGTALPTASKGSKEDRKGVGPSTSSPASGPSLPSTSGHAAGKRHIGPSFPIHPSRYDSDSDEDVGPKPLAAGHYEQPDPVKEFMEKEEKRRKAAEEALKPKAPKRDEWMLVPPTASSLLGNLDPSKMKGRQFSRGKTTQADNDMSLWTETPAERQQRLADEVQGKKRRKTDAVVEEDEEELNRKRRRKREEEGIRRGFDDYTKKRRGPALVDQHKEVLAKKPDEKEEDKPIIWDHTRDMAVGGRLMDDDKRGKMLREAKGLGDRFNSGKSGGFL